MGNRTAGDKKSISYTEGKQNNVKEKIKNDTEMKLYYEYQEVINPFIYYLSTIDVEYPTEIINEVRSIFTHLARYKLNDDEKQLIAAERHLKRAHLDCYKYSCLSHAEKLKEFRNQYAGVDLHLADNGKFLPTLNMLERKFTDLYIVARKQEIKMTVTEEELYSAYEDAYNASCDIVNFLKSSSEAILFASVHSKKNDIKNNIGLIVGIIGGIIGFVGILLTIFL